MLGLWVEWASRKESLWLLVVAFMAKVSRPVGIDVRLPEDFSLLQRRFLFMFQSVHFWCLGSTRTSTCTGSMLLYIYIYVTVYLRRCIGSLTFSDPQFKCFPSTQTFPLIQVHCCKRCSWAFTTKSLVMDASMWCAIHLPWRFVLRMGDLWSALISHHSSTTCLLGSLVYRWWFQVSNIF